MLDSKVNLPLGNFEENQEKKEEIWLSPVTKTPASTKQSKQEVQRATVAHLSAINASKIWLRNGTKNNNTSSYMFQDHCYAFSLLL